jgi:tetratricopeptide (TPR) repeat protein
MITDAPHQTLPTPAPEQAGGAASPARRTGRSRGPGTLFVALTALLAAGLLAFNAWWYWRDHRPIADLKTIAGWLARDQYALAEPALREHRRRSPHDGEVMTLLARLLAARGDYLGCARELHEVPFWWPTKVDALYREGQAYLMANRAADAERSWLNAIEDDPLHPGLPATVHDASLELLKLYSTEERWEDLHDILWNAYERANVSDHLTLLSMRIRAEMERIAPEVSISQLERYVAADPADWEALRALARAELAVGRKDEARAHFQKCIEMRPDDPRGWRDYLTMLHDLGDLEAWTALLAQVPPSAEGEPEIWRFRGLRKEKEGDWAGAAADYRQALKLNPYLPAAHYRLAMVEERLGHREAAAEHRKKTDVLREARNDLRTAYTDLINAEDARVKQTKASPDLPTSMRRLAVVCETLGWARLAEAWNKLAESS